MRLTTRGRYAVTAMIEIALHGSNRVPLGCIAGSTGIPTRYLEQLLGKLRRAGLIDATRGPNGGYQLATVSDDISVKDVIAAVDRLDATRCSGREDCAADGRQCLSHGVWAKLNESVEATLASMSLRKIVEDLPDYLTHPRSEIPISTLDIPEEARKEAHSTH